MPPALEPARTSTLADHAGREQRGIQSVEVGGKLLIALVDAGRPMALKDLAREAAMSPAKAHPYLVSFGKLGLITQDDSSARYALGPLALQLGLISLQQFEPVRLATAHLPELAQALGHTTAIVVWGNRGATIVRVEEAPTAVHVNMRHGTVMSLRGTASGMLFAAHLRREQVQAALADEHAASLDEQGRLRPATLKTPVDPTLEAKWAEIRRHGISRISGGAVPGVSAMAAPVFDEDGRIVLGLTAIGPTAVFDSRLEGNVALALRQTGRELSRQLGASDTSKR